MVENFFLAIIKIVWGLTFGVLKFFLGKIFPKFDWDSGTGALLMVVMVFGIIALCNLGASLLRAII